MKFFRKAMCIATLAAVLFTAITFLIQDKKDCCLCSSFRYHAPCLVDLDTGALVELELYAPDPTAVAQLAQVQPEGSTFSFIQLGNVSGFRLSGSRTIQLEIPRDKLQQALLCQSCRKMLPDNYDSRYAFADLYDANTKRLLPIKAGQVISLRCYQITTVENPQSGILCTTVLGTL